MRANATALVIAAGLILLAGCSPMNGLDVVTQRHAPKTDPSKMYRGVVFGLWDYDSKANEARLTGPYCEASTVEATRLSDRYQVRVIADRGFFENEGSFVVLLPEGWTYSANAVVDNGHTVNVGDIVNVLVEPARGIRSVVDLVRKCDAPAQPADKRAWTIGCRKVETFNKNGYGGEPH